MIRAISLWQPWASAMASGAKRIETRSWPTSYRGDLLICSAKRKPKFGECPDFVLANCGQLPFGFALCIVELYDCWPTERVNELRQSIGKAERDLGDYAPNRFAWLTRNCRTFQEPIPIVGRQGLWKLSEHFVNNFPLRPNGMSP